MTGPGWTAGPWIVDIDAHYGDGLPLTILGQSGHGVAGVAGHGDPLNDAGGVTDETWSNARLIAESPALATALRDLRDYAAMVVNRQHAGQPISDRIWSDLYAAANAASAVLARVEGE
jgi:hypothetical protein